MITSFRNLMPQIRLAASGGAALDDDLGRVVRLEGNTILVARSYMHAPAVRGFIARTERISGQKMMIRPVDMSDLVNTPQTVAATGGEVLSDSKMMEAAKRLFNVALQKRASDIHILVEGTTTISFRVHNDIRSVEEHHAEYGQRLCSAIYQAMASVSASTFNTREYQDAQISDRSKIPEGLDGIRIATAPSYGGFEMSLRLLYNDASDNQTLESLGFTPHQDNAMRFLRRLPHGINLIGGPTGSGKSTSLQRTLRLLGSECGHTKRILTVEDPPEYIIGAGVVQTPVTNADTEEERGKKFRAAIRSAMRRDPNVLMVGEVRDLASADLAFQASMTGHQVWTTLHVNGAFASLDRLENLGIAASILYDPSIVTGLISQRLLKRLCDGCKEPFGRVRDRYSLAEQNRIMRATKVEDLCVKGAGCEKCGGEGTVGRIAVVEIVITDHKIMSFLRNGDKMAAIDYWRSEQGGKTLLDNAIDRMNEGMVDPLEAENQLGPLTMTEILRDHKIEHEEVQRAGGH